MKKSSAIETVLGNGWLTAVSPTFAEALLRQCLLVQVPDGTLLYDHGSERGGLYGVASGRLGITLPVDLDGSALVFVGGPGFWTGNVAAFTDLPRQVGVVVLGDSWLFHLPVAAMNTLVSEDPETWRWLAALASFNLAASLEVIEGNATTDPARRVAKVLMRMKKHGAEKGGRVLATQAQLAQMALLSRSAANAALGRLAAEGAVSVSYGGVEITDSDLLVSLAYGAQPGRPGKQVTP